MPDPRALTVPDFRALFEAVPGNYLVLAVDPDHTVLAASNERLRSTLTRREDIVGRPLFDVFPDNPEAPAANGVRNLRASLERVIRTRTPDRMPVQRYDIQRPDGTFEQRHWRPLNTPVLGPDGGVAWIIHQVEDVSENVRLKAARTAQERLASERLSAVEEANTALAHASSRRRRAEADLQMLADSLPALISYIDRQERYRFVNRVYEAWFGRPREEFLGRTIREVIGDEAYAARTDAIAAALAGRAVRLEAYVPHCDGTTRSTELWAVPRRDEDGTVEGFYLLATDITDRRLAEDALRESEHRLRLAIDAGRMAVWELDIATDTILGSRELNRLLGFPENVSPSSEEIRSRYGPGERERLQKTAREALARGDRFAESELRYLWPDGSIRWLMLRADVQCAPDGTPSRYLGVVFDITERKRAEADRARFTERLEVQVAERTRERDRIWRLSLDLMLVARLDATIVAVNPAWGASLGWTEGELLYKDYVDLVHPDDRARTLSETGQLATGRLLLRFENRLRHRDGSYRWISWTAVPDEGVFHAIGRDVTTEKAAQETLRETEEQLRQAQKMEAVGQLTGGVAHDFNNLLQAIGGSVEVIQRRIEAGRTDVEQFTRAARQSVDRAAALTRRLLAFSRRQPLEPKVLDVNALVSGMKDLVRRSVGESVSVEMVLADAPWLTWADANQVENALLNLVLNARDAMPEGGRLTIETANAHLTEADAASERGVEPGQYVMLAVTDTGSGMPPDVKARAFEPFFTTKPVGQGSGLGLSQVYGFVRQSDGHVRVDSEAGKGTTVKLFLPCYRGPAVEDAGPATSAEPQPSGKGTVLVVEDEVLVSMLLVEVLTEQGYTVFEAAEASSAMKIIESPVTIDLLATDIGLSGTSGAQLATMARERRPGLKVLFLTGYAHNAEELAGGVLGGSVQLLSKPIAMNAFLAKVRTMVEDS